ncbi:suppressor of cytokine signaling 2 isoform X1 [Amyelois transitella]|uniref:suppressor of cytokine signaling 2 isoform X1 n=1 Tax=Amyelois transitella TaxID=680683 RepID=UPI0029907E07|nr:suppressor of cytokine signaling 2 isoform X1 [Amyelois transitella]
MEVIRLKPLNMTLAASLCSKHYSCVNVHVPYNGWPTAVGNCPNCRNELRVTLAPIPVIPVIPVKRPLHGPHSPVISSRDRFEPTYLPNLQIYNQHSAKLLPTTCNNELQRLADTLNALRLSGWYYGNLDLQGAINLLKDASVGAFLIRDSGDRNFIFSLSVQTDRGPTSVRLHYEHSFFRLDCDRPLVKYMPKFHCVVDLVQYYTRLGERGAAGTVWVNREGCEHSPVLLRNPFRKSPPSLLHCARLAVHKALDSNPSQPKLWCAPKYRLLPLPATLIEYLGKYPYSI